MTRITAAEAERDFADLLERVSEKGESFEIAKDGEVVARLEPTEHKKFTVGDLRELLKTLPPIDPEDLADWRKDLAEIRASARLPQSPWD